MKHFALVLAVSLLPLQAGAYAAVPATGRFVAADGTGRNGAAAASSNPAARIVAENDNTEGSGWGALWQFLTGGDDDGANRSTPNAAAVGTVPPPDNGLITKGSKAHVTMK